MGRQALIYGSTVVLILVLILILQEAGLKTTILEWLKINLLPR